MKTQKAKVTILDSQRPTLSPTEVLGRLDLLNDEVVDASDALSGIAMALPLAKYHADHAQLGYVVRLASAVEIIAGALGYAHEQIGDRLNDLKGALPSNATSAPAA